MRRPPEPDGNVYVDASFAARALDFGNASYGLLLQCLLQAFGHAGSDSVRQACFVKAAIALMACPGARRVHARPHAGQLGDAGHQRRSVSPCYAARSPTFMEFRSQY